MVNLNPEYVNDLKGNNGITLYVYKGIEDPELISQLNSEDNIYLSGHDSNNDEWKEHKETGQTILSIDPATFKTIYGKWIVQSIKKGILTTAFPTTYKYETGYNVSQNIDCIEENDKVYRLFTGDNSGTNTSSITRSKNIEYGGKTFDIELSYIPQSTQEGTGCTNVITSSVSGSNKCNGDVKIKGTVKVYREPTRRKENYNSLKKIGKGIEKFIDITPPTPEVAPATPTDGVDDDNNPCPNTCKNYKELEDKDYIKIKCDDEVYYQWTGPDPREDTTSDKGKIRCDNKNYYNVGPCERVERDAYELENALFLKNNSLRASSGTICDDENNVVTKRLSDTPSCDSIYSITNNLDSINKQETFTLFLNKWGWTEYLIIFVVVLLVCLGLYRFFSSKSK